MLSAPRSATTSWDVRPARLAELVRCADWIVVGQVTRVVERVANPDRSDETLGLLQGYPGLRVAEIKVLESLKGSPPARLAFLAQGTGLCDVTTAKRGETALLFLHRTDRPGDQSSKLRESVQSRLGVEFSRVTWWGLGRMVIVRDGEREHAAVSSDVKLPPSVGAVREGPFKLAPLGKLKAAIAAWVREQPGRPLLEARTTESAPGRSPWELFVAGDRSARLVVHEPAGDRDRRFEVPCRAMESIENVFAWMAQDATATLGVADSTAPVRTLRWFDRGNARTIELFPEWIDAAAVAGDKKGEIPTKGEPPTIDRALEAWIAARALFDDPAAHDSRDADAKLREAAR